MKQIGLVGCTTSNLGSIAHAIEFLGKKTIIITKKNELNRCSHIILPGVGSFHAGMQHLIRNDLLHPLICMHKKGTPILGICLGMQLFSQESEEFGKHEGMKLVPHSVKKVDCHHPKAKLPHVGWNSTHYNLQTTLYKNIPSGSTFYYTHSFAYSNDINEYVTSTTHYFDHPIIASIEKDNLFGVQFHPEKSQVHGLNLLKNFINLC